MHISQKLIIAAVGGVLAGCGSDPPPAATAPSTTAGAKASCGGADHTDKNHCSAGSATPSVATPGAPAATGAAAPTAPPAK